MSAPGTHYILIDHENIPTLEVGDIGALPVKVLVFLGEHTTKLALKDVKKLMTHAAKIDLIEIAGNGKNALDFHIAYYVGRISAADPGASIYIVSKDKGFDPLIAHLTARNVRVQRAAAVPKFSDARAARPAPAADADAVPEAERLGRLVEILTKNAKSRPRKRKTLVSTIGAHFNKQLSEDEVNALIAALERQGKLAIDEKGTVAYRL